MKNAVREVLSARSCSLLVSMKILAFTLKGMESNWRVLNREVTLGDLL